ncbi:lipase ROG1 family protein [Aspergillus tanneri]|uniref:DUF676 domain-containing protein n=1 Tax=Aspergillus tanneri TaxID=1220188 RepID=A0A5M9MKD0_9EURO|nr:uncharacterized protein ATNIH1004_007784 [Aspergillus tanneri]KAA8646356.1 hypothetical protein ATNIH1004_007784 [Aspergillus tanneri]
MWIISASWSMALEVEDTLGSLEAQGSPFTKLSIVGYSLGGLVARYAIGLLYSRGWFDKLEPVNFTTFASPHVVVRMPWDGLYSYLWNSLGPRSISMSGKQLFLVGSFLDSGKPLLSILADPDSVFVRALARFKHRCVYANIVNDRSTVFYTTAISIIDPFQQDLEYTPINYVDGYERVVIDSNVYTLRLSKAQKQLPFISQIWQQIEQVAINLPVSLFVVVLITVVLPFFLVNSAIQTLRSRQRIRLHEEGKSGAPFAQYRIPLLVKDVQHAVEDVFEDIRELQIKQRTSAKNTTTVKDKTNAFVETSPIETQSQGLSTDNRYPALTLTPTQISIIESLNSVGFRKYPVYIHNHRHSHAAIIRRVPKKGFDEARIVIKHWLDQEFEI